MSVDGPGGPGGLPLSVADWVDRACDRFEAAWRAGDAVATAALADLELRRLGLRSEAGVDRAQPR